MSAIEFEFTFVAEPPPVRHGRNTLYDAFRSALRGRSGEWAIYPKEMSDLSAKRTAANINRGMKMWPKGEFEARASGKHVYVRFIGGAS
jgi:hypothetical protein